MLKLLESCHLLACLADQIQDLLRPILQEAPGVGQTQLFAIALKKDLAQILLQ